MTDHRVPQRVAGCVEAEVDGQRVLLSPRDFSYFGIEGSGAAIWDLVDGQRTIDQIVAELDSRYDADEARIRPSTVRFLNELVRNGLLLPLAG